VKEAVRRDWQQTRHDLHAGGHELNQRGTDTLRQAAGTAVVPSINDANPPRVTGVLPMEWQQVMSPIAYGYAARRQFGVTHPEWNDQLAEQLRGEWEAAAHENRTDGMWNDVKAHVRFGYDSKN
jgi:hypothetical protein